MDSFTSICLFSLSESTHTHTQCSLVSFVYPGIGDRLVKNNCISSSTGTLLCAEGARSSLEKRFIYTDVDTDNPDGLRAPRVGSRKYDGPLPAECFHMWETLWGGREQGFHTD